eukprot:363221-Chlamydomonas_euryale.AAC.10
MDASSAAAAVDAAGAQTNTFGLGLPVLCLIHNRAQSTAKTSQIHFMQAPCLYPVSIVLPGSPQAVSKHYVVRTGYASAVNAC